MEKFKDIWENGIISFDTCSLGRMYEWESLYAVNIKDAISYLFRVNKLWETEIVIQEFSKQRIEIRESIYEQKYVKGIFNALNKRPVPWNKIDRAMGRWEAKGFSEQFKDGISRIHGKKKITDDFSLTEEEKNAFRLRYDSGAVCPGSGDSRKNNGNKYNDLYIWELLKKKAKTDEKDIIFVTSDCKDDWFENERPRLEYIDEFHAETGQDIVILTLSDFWENCKDFLDVSVDKFLELSSIKEQLEEKYDDCYHAEICEKIEDLLMESDEIREVLETEVKCCVDMPVLDELIETVVEDMEVIDYDEEKVSIAVYLQTEACFKAINHTCGENWPAGYGSVLLSITVSAEIPVIWASEDTERMVLDDSVSVEEIMEIEVSGR